MGVKDVYGAAPRGRVHEKCVSKDEYDDLLQRYTQSTSGSQFGTGTQGHTGPQYETGQQYETGTQGDTGYEYQGYGPMTSALLSMDYPDPFPLQQPAVYSTDPPLVFSSDPPPAQVKFIFSSTN